MDKFETNQPPPIDINWQQYLDVIFPYLGKIYLTEQKMKDINERLSSRNNQLQITRGQYPTTFYDLFLQIISPDANNPNLKPAALGLLPFLNATVKEFIDLTRQDPVLLLQLKDQMEGMFLDNEAKYLDCVGELLSVMFLIRKFAPARLSSLQHHYFLKNGMIDNKGKDADLHFFMEDGEQAIVDVLNITLAHERITDQEGLIQILTYRIRKKWKEKKFDDLSLHDRYSKILIQPFIWIYDLETIEGYKETIKNLNLPEALPVLLMQQSSDGNGRKFYECVQI